MEERVLQRRRVEAAGYPFDVAVLGDGPPTVVFVNGLGSPLEEWALVAPRIAERCRVVCYDRRGAPPKGQVLPHGADQIAADLSQLLDALDISGPLVLVGHSWGGAVARRYAFDHPDDVAGLVFVDATHEDVKGMIPRRPRVTQALYTGTTLLLRVGPIRRRLLRMLGFDRLPPTAMAEIDKLRWLADGRTSRAEFAGIGTSLQELARLAPDLPPVPTCVLLAAGRSGLMAKLGARQVADVRNVWEQAVAGRSDITLHAVPDSGHYISLDQPEAVIDAIADVVSRVSLGRVG